MGVTRTSLDELLTTRQVAEYLGVTENAVALDRHHRRGFPYVRISGRIRYRARDIEEYLNANTVSS